MGVRSILRLLLRRRRLLLGVLAAVAVAAFAASFLIAPRWRATAKVVVSQPGEGGALARFGNVAGALGLDIGQGPNPLDLYAQYLLSRDLLREVVTEELPLKDGGATTILAEWGEGDDEAERLDAAVEELGRSLQVAKREEAGVLEITAETFDPVASSYLANDLVARLNAFDAELKRWSGRNRSEFLGARRAEILADLRAAEDSLTAFRMANRSLEHPRLRQEEMRLLREVAIQGELLQTIRVQEELARLDAKTEGPVLKTIQRAVPPVERSWPRRGRIVALALVVAAVLLVYGLVVVEHYGPAEDV